MLKVTLYIEPWNPEDAAEERAEEREERERARAWRMDVVTNVLKILTDYLKASGFPDTAPFGKGAAGAPPTPTPPPLEPLYHAGAWKEGENGMWFRPVECARMTVTNPHAAYVMPSVVLPDGAYYEEAAHNWRLPHESAQGAAPTLDAAKDAADEALRVRGIPYLDDVVFDFDKMLRPWRPADAEEAKAGILSVLCTASGAQVATLRPVEGGVEACVLGDATQKCAYVAEAVKWAEERLAEKGYASGRDDYEN